MDEEMVEREREVDRQGNNVWSTSTHNTTRHHAFSVWNELELVQTNTTLLDKFSYLDEPTYHRVSLGIKVLTFKDMKLE